MNEWEILQESAHAVREALRIGELSAETGLILGSGLGAFGDTLENQRCVQYEEIPHFAASRVQGHAGRLIAGEKHGLPLLVMQGRTHYYEGHDITLLARPVRVLYMLGIRKLIITNAAGSVRKDIGPGSIVAIRDHINMLGANPLRGPNEERLGVRFPDMSSAYEPELRKTARATAQLQGWEMKEGVYACMPGPSYETPAEVKMVSVLGGDLVGMSTVPEVIAARHMGMKILGLSCVTNMAAGLSEVPLSHEEVEDTANSVREKFLSLLDGVLREIAST